MKTESQEPASAQGNEQAIHPIETETRLYLSQLHVEIAQRPLGWMEMQKRITASPPGEMRIQVTRTSSFSCLVRYVWQPSVALQDQQIHAHGEIFRYIFDQEAEKAAAAVRLQAAPPDTAGS